MSENQRNYIPLIIPINKPFAKLNKKEAKMYFDWFVSHVDERSEYIRQKVSEGLNISIESLDYSADSLVLIWRWFLKIVELNKTPKAVLKNVKKNLEANGEGKEYIDYVLHANSVELSFFSRYVIRDIAMYVGKMFVINFSSLRWDYYTNRKKDAFVNTPQVFGFVYMHNDSPFEMQWEPIRYTEMEASRLFDNTQSEKDLYNMYMRWCKWIPNDK